MDDIKLTNKEQDSYLKKQIQTGNFASFMLFTGQEGAGKADSAYKFANAVLCANQDGEPCQICDNCKLLNSNSHPDLICLGGGETIKIAEIRDLQKTLYLKPYKASHKVAIIKDAHLMTEESANALLKVLEEPPKSSVIILTSPDKALLPETVVSRSQVVNFGTNGDSEVFFDAEVLKDTSLILGVGGSLYERFSTAHKYAKDKKTATMFLDSLEMVSRQGLLGEGNSKQNIRALENIQESRRYLGRNLSGKFVLENLILTTNYK
ncbi:hypothetical protein C4544_06665 [candidate division WS5 bacterium]|uniref:DNA polymerase III subunit delta n=1 Tax=candidate division WS5 bacterium TaxID=2093353 RepID=A0A419DA42_9BACT|nr:MAG: hypothetical protein C4544_06665 [candidate division WS5 bacterium]